MNKAAVESASPPHPGRPHASFRRNLSQKPRSHNPVMMGSLVIVMVETGGESWGGAAAISHGCGCGGVAGVGAEIQHWHMMIQSINEIRRGRRIRHLVVMIEPHLLVLV